MYSALSWLLYLRDLEEQRGGGRGILKSSYSEQATKGEGPIFIVGVDPSIHHGIDKYIYIYIYLIKYIFLIFIYNL